jgi:capsular polysaccharide biosynthesis protein
LDTKISGDKIEVVLKNEEIEEDVISLNEIVKTILKGKYKIIGTIVFFLIVALIFTLYNKSTLREVKSIISYNYDGIESGLDPGGNSLDTSQIKAPAVLDKVIKKMNLSDYGIDTEILRNSMSINPIIPGDVQQKIDEINEQKKSTSGIKNPEDAEYKYYPKEFEVVLYIPNKNINNNKAEEILNEVIKSYSNYFYSKYTDRNILANVVKDLDYEKYDYSEISDVINTQINLLNSFLGKVSVLNTSTNFRSKTTGMSFDDILKSVSVIKQVDINRIDSLIDVYNLTKNKDKLIKLYEYRIKRLEVEKNKKYDESVIASDMMGKFEREESIMFSNSTEDIKDDEEDENKDNSYYSDLADKSLNAGVEAKNSAHDIEYYENLIERLNNDEIPEKDKKKIAAEVLTISKSVAGKLEKWIDISNDTVSEFYEGSYDNSIIKRRTPSQTYISGPKRNMVLGIALLAGLLVGVLLTFVTEYLKKIKSETITNENEKLKPIKV